MEPKHFFWAFFLKTLGDYPIIYSKHCEKQLTFLSMKVAGSYSLSPARNNWVSEELQKRLRDTPSMGSALGGKINVTLSGDLAPLGVEIDESLMEEGEAGRSWAMGWGGWVGNCPACFP